MNERIERARLSHLALREGGYQVQPEEWIFADTDVAYADLDSGISLTIAGDKLTIELPLPS
jgi:hypothetical protein